MKLVVLSPSSLPEELLAGLGHLCESEGFAVAKAALRSPRAGPAALPSGWKKTRWRWNTGCPPSFSALCPI